MEVDDKDEMRRRRRRRRKRRGSNGSIDASGIYLDKQPFTDRLYTLVVLVELLHIYLVPNGLFTFVT